MNLFSLARKACIAMIGIAVLALSAVSTQAHTTKALGTIIDTQQVSVYVMKLGGGDVICFNATPVVSLDDSIAPKSTLLPVLEGDTIKSLIDKEIIATTDFIELLKKQQRELSYYMITHTKKDEGYKEVAAFGKKHKEQIKRLNNNLSLLKKAAAIFERESRTKHLKAELQQVYLFNGKSVAPGGIHLTPDNVILLHENDSTAVCNYALAMKQLFAPDDTNATCSVDRKGNIYRLLNKKLKHKTAAAFGERFGRDGSYYMGYFNSQQQRFGSGYCVDTTLVRCGDWDADAYTGQIMRHHPGRIYGIDISRYNHDMKNVITVARKIVTPEGKDSTIYVKTKTADIDWTDLRITELGPNSPKVDGEVNYPVEFAFIKCSEGMDLLSKYYNADLDSCLAHGIRVAPYHFYSSKSKPIDQAANFIAHARINECTMRPMLDVEPEPHQLREMGGIHACIKGMVVFVNEVEAKTGRKCVLYLNQNFVKQYYHLFPEELRQCDIWIAKYHEKHPYTRFCIWQFGCKGRVKGIYGNVDLNVFNGNRQEFERWCEAE